MLTLFIDKLSQPSRAVLWLFKLCGVQHTVKLIRIANGETRSAEFEKINPVKKVCPSVVVSAAKVPAIDDNGFHVWESNTIMRYICQTRSLPDQW
jgi:glutathione S-transferase